MFWTMSHHPPVAKTELLREDHGRRMCSTTRFVILAALGKAYAARRVKGGGAFTTMFVPMLGVAAAPDCLVESQTVANGQENYMRLAHWGYFYRCALVIGRSGRTNAYVE